jgi:broad specificity phosphatase PhoE
VHAPGVGRARAIVTAGQDERTYQPRADGGIRHPLISWQNRPTYQQAVSFPADRGDDVSDALRHLPVRPPGVRPLSGCPAHGTIGGVIAELMAVRHGQSRANVAFPAADAAGALDAGLTGRDADVELTALGRAQADALGRRLAALPADRRPEVIVCSPFRRARDTWAIAAAHGSWPEPEYDDRLVDRRMGELELLTRAAVAARHPGEQAKRDADWYHYRPPAGENFADMHDRLSAFLADAHHEHAGRRLLVVAHDSVVLMLRGVLEGLDPAQIDAVEKQAGYVRNASVSRFVAAGGGWRVAAYNDVDHLSTVTAGPDEG